MRSVAGRIHLASALLLAALTLPAAPARATRVAPEFFVGTGVSSTDYSPRRLASLSTGLGLRFVRHVAVGGKAYFDDFHNFFTGYAAVYLLPDAEFGFYGRGELGRRNDLSDETAVGWAAGIYGGSSGVRFYLEVGGFVEPGYVDGANVGVLFHGGARLR